MQKLLYSLILLFLVTSIASAQKTTINRKVAQKNYEGYLLLQDKKYEEALNFFNEAIKDDPEAFFIYQNRAICRLQLKDTVGAISDFKTNIQLEPANTESKYALGNIYKKQLDSLNATYWFKQALEQAEDDFSQVKLLYMNNFLGTYFTSSEKYDSALIYFNHSKVFDSENPSIFINSAVCYFHLDSINRFCEDLERAFVLGGNVNCFALKSYCKGCSHLLDERGGNVDTLSMVLDKRLLGIIPDTMILSPESKPRPAIFASQRTSRIYFNQDWQICMPENASYYRESFWAKDLNFFGGNFTDFYADGRILAEGRIEFRQLNGPFTRYFRNGQVQTKGEFNKGMPVGKWLYYQENGDPDFEIEFTMGDYKLHFLNPEDPNFKVNSGTGHFSILLDNWHETRTSIEGNFENHLKTGDWKYIQDETTLVNEVYKKDKYKRGYMITVNGRVTTTSTVLDATFFTLPYLLRIEQLFFDSIETVGHYSFIRMAEN